MARPRSRKIVNEGPILAPFTVGIDTREQLPYAFKSIMANADQGGGPIAVPTERITLRTGDYSVLGYSELVAIERKSKADLYGSVANRDNFVARLERMTEIASRGGYCAIVVECEMGDCLIPPDHSKLNPKALNRTILAWRQRYRCDWYFLPDRSWGESFTYRILERFWLDHHENDS